MTEDIEVDGGVKVHTVDEAAKARSMCRSASRWSSMFSLGISGSPTRHVFVARMGFFCVERVLHERDFKGFSFLWFLSLVFQIHWKLLGVQNKYQTSRISMLFGSLVCFFFFADEEKQKRDWLVQCLAARPEQTWSCQALVSTRPFCKTWIGPTGSMWLVYSPITIPSTWFKCRKICHDHGSTLGCLVFLISLCFFLKQSMIGTDGSLMGFWDAIDRDQAVMHKNWQMLHRKISERPGLRPAILLTK